MSINLNELILSDEIKFLDLTKELGNVDQALIISQEYPVGQIEEFYRQIEQGYIDCQQDEKDTRHKKILLSSLPSYFYKCNGLRPFLHALRCLTRSSHVTTLITLPPIISDEVR